MLAIEAPGADDLDPLVDLWVALVRSQQPHGSHLLAGPNRSSARDLLAQYVVSDDVLVARIGTDLVGFVMFHIESGFYAQDATRGVVDNLYVDPDYREAGIGSRLLAEAEDALADEGASVVALSAMATNDAARRLYREAGYDLHRVELEKEIESDTHSRE
ncbi:GNAT family N-acetyltransferase [Halobacteriaceae archaeon GCM10025711]